MAKPPVVLLAFADDHNDPLSGLTKEEEALRDLLHPLDQKGIIELQIISKASVDNLFKAFSEYYANRVMIFHYSGHANSESLLLRGKEANSEGLASIITQQENLKLVFLNGCSTQEQVKALLEGEVPNVIATSVPINDHKAVKFSTQLYSSLVGGSSIAAAYDAANGRLNTDGEQVGGSDSVRTFGNKIQTIQIPEKAWNLFQIDDNASNWKLPTEPAQAMGLEAFKKKMRNHIDEGEFQKVFDGIKKSKYRYQKFLLNHLEQEFGFGINLQAVNSLKVLVGSLKEPEA